jgi:DNA invertase Pin-like site-specific DNA recombinase
MLIGYARVSTAEQNLDLQTDAVNRAGCEKLFTDKAGGARAERPAGLDQALTHLRKGDTLVVWKLVRLGRSIRHLIETVGQLQEQKVGFRSLQKSIDTTTSGGKLVFHVFALQVCAIRYLGFVPAKLHSAPKAADPLIGGELDAADFLQGAERIGRYRETV